MSKQFQLQNKTLLTSFCAKVFHSRRTQAVENFKIGEIREEEESSRPLNSTKFETRAIQKIWWYLRIFIIGWEFLVKFSKQLDRQISSCSAVLNSSTYRYLSIFWNPKLFSKVDTNNFFWLTVKKPKFLLWYSSATALQLNRIWLQLP